MNFSDWIVGNFDRNSDWALITGASSGIGLEYLYAIAKLGCNCLIVSNETDVIQRCAVDIENNYKIKVKSYYCDFSNYNEILDFYNKIKDFSIRILINNAGFGLKGDFLSVDVEKYKNIVMVNSLAPTVLSHFFLPDMIASRKGLHINIATINVVSPIPYNTVYTATKFYTYAYSLAVHYEYADSGVFFQLVLPGTTDTPFHEKQGSKPSAMTMKPQDVVAYSLSNISKKICIPNRADRFFYIIASFIPVFLRMRLSAFIAKKRLGLNY